jgi:hypothetical protein
MAVVAPSRKVLQECGSGFLLVQKHLLYRPVYLGLVKGKAVPLQAWSDPEGSTKLSFPDFMITA